jgi:DNA-binding response OmpR family regulator
MTTDASHILIAEDEAMIGMMVEDFLDQLGYQVAGNCMTNAQCTTLLDSGQRIDAALLDCNLGDGPIWPVARRLRDMGIPFVFASGDGHGVPADLAGNPSLGKPFMLDDLDRTLARLLGR